MRASSFWIAMLIRSTPSALAFSTLFTILAIAFGTIPASSGGYFWIVNVLGIMACLPLYFIQATMKIFQGGRESRRCARNENEAKGRRAIEERNREIEKQNNRERARENEVGVIKCRRTCVY